jgi:hypothetical protein
MATRKPLNPNSPFFHEERHASLDGATSLLITICGAGALGGNLAETLARMGFYRLRLIDRDKVEMRNLSTQPYVRQEVGRPKATTLANHLYRAVQARVEPVVTTLTFDNAHTLLAGSDLVVDCFDNQEGRSAVGNACVTAGIPCLHVGFSGDGLYGSGRWEPGYLVPHHDPNDPCDYPLTRRLMHFVTALAVESLIKHLTEGQRLGFDFTLRDQRVVWI